MPHATARDGVKLYYEAAGSGMPLLFIHEFAGDYRSWEPQMGGFAALHAGIAYPERARSLVIAGCGYGAEPDKKEKFRAECEAAAYSFESDWTEAAKKYALGPARVQFQNKDP